MNCSNVVGSRYLRPRSDPFVVSARSLLRPVTLAEAAHRPDFACEPTVQGHLDRRYSEVCNHWGQRSGGNPLLKVALDFEMAACTRTAGSDHSPFKGKSQNNVERWSVWTAEFHGICGTDANQTSTSGKSSGLNVQRLSKVQADGSPK